MSTPSTSKPKRRGLPKTKSGCRTCKVRRVKCGEEKPKCHRCIKFGIACDGYGPLPNASKTMIKKIQPLLPKGTDRRPSLSVLQFEPPQSLFSTEQDHRYFEVFCSKTAFEILPAFDSSNLREVLLQACVSEPSIRHAVVALGALDLTAESLQDFEKLSLDDQNENPNQHHQNALRRYTTAIKEMRIASAEGEQDFRITLLTCFVILCFEAWNGNQDLAVRQIQTGLRLVQAWREEMLTDQKRQTITDDELMKTFSKLDVQAISFAEESTSERHALAVNGEQELLDDMPASFSTIREAEMHESALLRQSMRFLAIQVPLPKPHPPKRAFPVNGWWRLQDPRAVSIQQTIVTGISNWVVAFEPLWTRLKTENADEKSLLIASMLRLHMEACFIALLSVCSFSEEIFDEYNVTFSEMVDLATFTLQIMDQNRSKKPKFSFDSHVVIPLHMVAHKCRDRTIRRRAIELLMENPRREGVWDSTLGAKIGGWAMAIEEEFCDEEGKVPEWARIHGVVFERDQERRSALLTCEQRTSADSEEVVVRRKIVNW
ncbi:uncharacterized protein PAC_03149 [Phialocephala subalpina]|uniref:Zn(2)-C6 fungal-type domain-containing protein n=1 Tax=Phialocephala subalpina TaxID=576137 RepID=A0A1L7WKI1_9HELO|nr:uncharacterized protein PAC_03149 [Phialocephala subalpina]